MRTRYAVAMAFAAVMIAPPIWLQTSNELVAGADYLYILVSGICTILAWLVGRRWGFRGKFGLVHLGFAAGILLEFIGNLVWTIYELVLEIQVPFPSFADVCFLVGYVSIAIGMGQFLRTFRGRRWKRWDFFLGSGLVLSWVGLRAANWTFNRLRCGLVGQEFRCCVSGS